MASHTATHEVDASARPSSEVSESSGSPEPREGSALGDGARFPRVDPRSCGERSSASLLVRCWLERPEREGGAPVLRGYLKNLRTGEEQFIKDLDTVGEQILRQLGAATAEIPGGWLDVEAGRASEA